MHTHGNTVFHTSQPRDLGLFSGLILVQELTAFVQEFPVHPEISMYIQGFPIQWSLPKRTLREADNSLQRTEAMSPTCPLFGDSTVYPMIFLYDQAFPVLPENICMSRDSLCIPGFTERSI